MIKVWNSRSRGGGEGNVDETGNNPSVSLKLEESESNNSYIYHGTLILKIGSMVDGVKWKTNTWKMSTVRAYTTTC